MEREYTCHWKCPACGHEQDDSIHPDEGPYVSITCGACMRSFCDEDLDSISLDSIEAARCDAEKHKTVNY